MQTNLIFLSTAILHLLWFERVRLEKVPQDVECFQDDEIFSWSSTKRAAIVGLLLSSLYVGTCLSRTFC